MRKTDSTGDCEGEATSLEKKKERLHSSAHIPGEEKKTIHSTWVILDVYNTLHLPVDHHEGRRRCFPFVRLFL
jgi:hypothetical protein